jgi:hypothetical protein
MDSDNMGNKESSYEIIQNKIETLKKDSPFYRNLSDDKVFSILCVKSNFYKNPSYKFSEEDVKNILVDSTGDGGVDMLLSDPNNSETSDLIICQSKHYKTISFDQVCNAVHKMVSFYIDMDSGNFHVVNPRVQTRFHTLNAEVGDDSKVHFVFYTSAPKNSIRKDRLDKIIKERLKNTNRYLLDIYFDKDIVEEIKEAESRRPFVEHGTLFIDRKENYLEYGENSAILNISAFSLKRLYSEYNTNLLSRNLRYYIRKVDIDSEINRTIKEDSDSFWYKNNGITIICDSFLIDGIQLKMTNFSIVNGGQTTTLISKNEMINK